MKGTAIHQHIIETASNLFYKNGYNATGINEIIAEAKIAKATLYNHFKSKEDICLAYLGFKHARFIKDISTYCLNKKQGDAQVLGVFDFLLKFFKDKDFNGCWCIKTVAEIPNDNKRIRSVIQEQKNELIDLIHSLVIKNIDGLTKKEERTMARQVYLLYESAVAESHLHKADWPIKESRKVAIKMVS